MEQQVKGSLMFRGLIGAVLVIPLGAIVVFGSPSECIGDGPRSCFVVHCEPTNASDGMFLELEKLVELAGRFSVPLTIYFTPQWAEMILADPQKLSVAEAWIDAGHEVGAHHHAYWATKDRAATWDGYTNTSILDLEEMDRDSYLGTMCDALDLWNALPGECTSGCLGLDEGDRADWPCTLRYETYGHALEEAVSTPRQVSYEGCVAWAITHALIIQPQGALPELYESTSFDRIFCVVGHVYNFEEDRSRFEFWFRFLQSQDPAGDRRRTVTRLLQAWENDGA